MRLRRGQEFNSDSHLDLGPPPPPVTWLPGVLSKGVRLRLRLDHRDDRAEAAGSWSIWKRSRSQVGGDRGATPLTPMHKK
ncbi:hypothetical protein INR49_026729 [Caranx melampygus]|nr:hypothetical protein INR49_026729 [Caranx melampygus]